MKLTGKCKENFEVWFEDKYDNNNTSDVIMLQTEFDSMPFEFKYSVYVDYFDSVGVDIEICKYPIAQQYYYMINDGDEENIFETRPQARVAAIERANKLHNEVLSN